MIISDRPYRDMDLIVPKSIQIIDESINPMVIIAYDCLTNVWRPYTDSASKEICVIWVDDDIADHFYHRNKCNPNTQEYMIKTLNCDVFCNRIELHKMIGDQYARHIS